MKSIERKIKVVEERVSRLKRIASEIDSFQHYQKSQDKRDIAERNLQVAIEACLDIAKMIITRENLSEPRENKATFAVLFQKGIVSEKSMSFLAPMAGTRNILVHNYDSIDDEVVYGILKRHSDDFMTFISEIKKNYLIPQEQIKI